MKETSLKTKAFTLIELLVVVAIISLLSSVVIASVSDAREKAALSSITQQIRQVQTALEMYRIDNGDYPENDLDYYSLDKIISTDLSNYIQSPSLPVNQIRSFKMTNIGDGTYFNYVKNPFETEPDILFSCEGYSNVPYVITATTNHTDLDYPHVLINDGKISAGYCFSSSI